MNVEIGNCRIKPHPNSLCWMLEKFCKVEKKDGTESMEWVSMNRYPSTFKGAVAQCIEFELKDGGDVEGWREVIKRLDEIADMIAGLETR